MGHHIPALPLPVPLTAPKIATPRWRPRIRAKAPELDEAEGAPASGDSDAVFAAGGALDGKPRRRLGISGGKAGPAVPSWSGLTARALTDDTLRALLLIGQEDHPSGGG